MTVNELCTRLPARVFTALTLSGARQVSLNEDKCLQTPFPVGVGEGVLILKQAEGSVRVNYS